MFDVDCLPAGLTPPQRAALAADALAHFPIASCLHAQDLCEAVTAWAFEGDLAAAAAAEWGGAATYRRILQLRKEARERHAGALNAHGVWSCCGAGPAEVCAGGKVPHVGTLAHIRVPAVTREEYRGPRIYRDGCAQHWEGGSRNFDDDQNDWGATREDCSCDGGSVTITVTGAYFKDVWSCCPLAKVADSCRRTPPAQEGGADASPGAEAQCSAPTCTKTATARCTCCRAACYCGEDCQRAHWPAHKLECHGPAASGGGGGGSAP